LGIFPSAGTCILHPGRLAGVSGDFITRALPLPGYFFSVLCERVHRAGISFLSSGEANLRVEDGLDGSRTYQAYNARIVVVGGATPPARAPSFPYPPFCASSRLLAYYRTHPDRKAPGTVSGTACADNLLYPYLLTQPTAAFLRTRTRQILTRRLQRRHRRAWKTGLPHYYDRSLAAAWHREEGHGCTAPLLPTAVTFSTMPALPPFACQPDIAPIPPASAFV